MTTVTRHDQLTAHVVAIHRLLVSAVSEADVARRVDRDGPAATVWDRLREARELVAEAIAALDAAIESLTTVVERL